MIVERVKGLVSAGLLAASAALAGAAGAQQNFTTDVGTFDAERLAGKFPPRPYSPYAGRNFPSRPLFGDTHLHTAFSMDAGAAGARLSPRDAYRFARGEEIISSTGQPVKLSRPLDFLVVADHSDNMGFFPDLFAGKPHVLADPVGRRWYDLIQSGRGVDAALDIILTFSNGTWPKDLLYVPGTPAYRSTWEQTIKAAEEANEPGRFTAFIGYEWTSNTGGNNLHRNVIYRDGGDLARQMEPMVTMQPWGSDNPRELWKWMQAYEEKTGGRVLAIAHNGNLSNGIMFPMVESFTGRPVDLDYAETRARWERLYEATQMKGDSEAHPALSPNDEFADYETWDKGNLNLTAAKKPEMLEFEYARAALKNGLKLEAELGVNPYKFGLVGSTDSHTGLTTAEEENFFSKVSSEEPSAERMTKPFMKGPDGLVITGWEITASGYAAVWAAENSREAIWDAMQRRETYATTGPRMLVRFFGGWDFTAADALTRSPAVAGYMKGVPMGGDLRDAPAGKAPSFLVAALRDPIGANLDRIQIVKGWLDAAGTPQERIYDVVVSDGRTIEADGRCRTPVGNTVDVANAIWTNTIGDPELIAVWTDPDFDPALRAFYYARVIEIPTPRWTAYDAKFYGLTNLDPAIPMSTQERAYTSPIWYSPAG
ncbi:MAG TPA: DUF3604 domain-containing protein [Paracoccaceae bacterium]|nr:DUF3604 domain-containing protein [Paracoccaceae bacterium]